MLFSILVWGQYKVKRSMRGKSSFFKINIIYELVLMIQAMGKGEGGHVEML